MNIYASMSYYGLNLSEEDYPMMQDVIDAKVGDLESWESFLPAWKKVLMEHNTDRAAALLMEVSSWLEGIEGVARLARGWKATQPRGYLFWIQCLIGEGDWQSVLVATQEALEVLPKEGFRVQVSQYLIQAAQELGEERYILQGKCERFFSSCDEQDLLGLLDEAIKQNLRTRELENALEFLQSHRQSGDVADELYVKVLLMSAKLGKAFCVRGKRKRLLVGLMERQESFLAASYLFSQIALNKR